MENAEQDNFYKIVEGAPDPIFIQSDLKFAYLNTAACHLFGIKSPDELLGTPVMDRFHPDYHDLIKNRIYNLNEKKKPVKDLLEQRFIRIDGSEVWVETTGEPILYNGKNSALVFVRNITERKAAEEALKNSEHQFHLLAEAATIGVAISDYDGNNIYTNQHLTRLFGYDMKDIPTIEHWWPLAYPDEEQREKIKSEWLNSVSKAVSTNSSIEPDEQLVTCKDGTKKYIEFRTSVTDKLIFVIIIDLTERKKAEESLRKSEERYRNTLDNMIEGCQIIGFDWRYIYINDAAQRHNRRPKEELLGKRYMDVWPGIENTEVFNKIRLCLTERTSFRMENLFIFPDGTEGWFVLVIQPVNEGVFILSIDITGRKEAEKEKDKLQEQLLQSQKIESVGRLAGGVAHDFNNMLSVIKGYSELVMEQLGTKHEIYQDIKEILDAANRSADITKQLLAFARKQNIAPVTLDVNSSITKILKMLQRLIGEDIDLAWIPQEGLWPVKIDPSQIDQIMANLCVNARDAIEGVGKITIETHNVTFDEQYCADHYGFFPGDYVMLAVSDDGLGMDKETLKLIFDPFFTTKNPGSGTGLGLSTVYGILKQNNGFINVYSESGKGATFKLYLPRETGEGKIKEFDDSAVPPRGAGETILIVEDEKAIRDLTGKVLENHGYNVLTAETPTKALQLAKKHSGVIHLLVTDVVMPEMNGRELAKKIENFYPDIKVLFMSGYTSNVIVHRGVLDDGVNFLPKPFSHKDLTQKVYKALYIGK